MLNKDKRSLVLSLVLGDGCLHYVRNGHKEYGALTLDHGVDQADYVAWKAQLVGKIVGRNINVRQGHKGNSVQFSVCMKRFRAWRKFCYPGGKKDRTRILRFIRHPEFALAVWLMDDGYIEGVEGKEGRKGRCSGIRLFTCSSTEEVQQGVIIWFQNNFGITPVVKWQLSWNKKRYPFLKIYQRDAYRLWDLVRPMVLQFASMRHKFRIMEAAYQLKGL